MRMGSPQDERAAHRPPARRSGLGVSLIGIVLLQAAAMFGRPAHADCPDLVAALQHARGQSRVAQLLVDDAGHPDGTDPVTLRIDGMIYEHFDGLRYATRGAPAADALAAALGRAPFAARCEREGSGTHAGVEVIRFRFVHPDLGPEHNPVEILVARASSLPVYHTYPGLGSRGFAWIYGDLVRDPAQAPARS
jgi:hypothetical protein